MRGDTVIFINTDRTRNCIVCNTRDVPNSGLLHKNEQYSVTFSRNGNYFFSSSFYLKAYPLHVIVKDWVEEDNSKIRHKIKLEPIKEHTDTERPRVVNSMKSDEDSI